MYEAITVSRSRSYQLRYFWYDFCTATSLFNREADLNRLIQWAVGKRVIKPRRLYEWRLQETQAALQRIRYRTPHAITLARLCSLSGRILNPHTTYPKKGSATKYRRTVC